MPKIYTIGQALKKSKLVQSLDGYEVYCDGYTHYLASPSTVEPQGPCDCPGGPTAKASHTEVAKQRYEIYNKDADFFWDHETGALYWLQLSGGARKNWSLEDPSLLVEKIIELLNRDDNAAILLSRESEPPVT